MGQVLRITFNNVDYNYQVLNTGPVSKETAEIRIQLEGVGYTLVRQEGQWVPQEGEETAPRGLLLAIGRSLGSRYRI